MAKHKEFDNRFRRQEIRNARLRDIYQNETCLTPIYKDIPRNPEIKMIDGVLCKIVFDDCGEPELRGTFDHITQKWVYDFI